jgi:hypothetical protein
MSATGRPCWRRCASQAFDVCARVDANSDQFTRNNRLALVNDAGQTLPTGRPSPSRPLPRRPLLEREKGVGALKLPHTLSLAVTVTGTGTKQL